MRRSIYRQLAHSLLQDCRETLDRFAASATNREVFAFALDCDPFNGDVVICLNTNPGYRAVARKHRAEAMIDDGRGLHGLRYRSASFAVRESTLSEDTLQLLDEVAATQHDAKTDRTAERHAEMLLSTLAHVVLMLGSSFDKLDLTPDFLAYVTEFRADERARIELMRKTVTASDFDAVFPEIKAFSSELAALESETPSRQARYWGNALRDTLSGAKTHTARRLSEIGRAESDMLESLRRLGSHAVPTAIDLLDGVLHDAQGKKKGAQTREGKLAVSLMAMLRDVRLVDEEGVEQLQTMLRNHVKASTATDGVSAAFALADLLHALRPHRFPPAERSGDASGLANARAFDLR
jgi:hypothetical protein